MEQRVRAWGWRTRRTPTTWRLRRAFRGGWFAPVRATAPGGLIGRRPPFSEILPVTTRRQWLASRAWPRCGARASSRPLVRALHARGGRARSTRAAPAAARPGAYVRRVRAARRGRRRGRGRQGSAGRATSRPISSRVDSDVGGPGRDQASRTPPSTARAARRGPGLAATRPHATTGQASAAASGGPAASGGRGRLVLGRIGGHRPARMRQERRSRGGAPCSTPAGRTAAGRTRPALGSDNGTYGTSKRSGRRATGSPRICARATCMADSACRCNTAFFAIATT